MPSAEGFLGTWVLVPASCNFDLGAPPRDGRYRIERAGEGLKVSMKWADHAGTVRANSFEAVPDGRLYPGDGGIDALSMVLTEDDVLDTLAYRDGEVMMVTRRVLSQDQRTMTVLMSGRRADGSLWENRAVYRLSPT